MAKGKAGLGQRGEALATAALRDYGLEIIARNWRCTYGEADIIAQREQDLYFVEVRTRRGAPFPTPEQTLTSKKHRHMDLVARAYLGSHTMSAQITWHLSFIAITMDRSGRLQRMTFYPDLYGEPVNLTWRP